MSIFFWKKKKANSEPEPAAEPVEVAVEQEPAEEAAPAEDAAPAETESVEEAVPAEAEPVEEAVPAEAEPAEEAAAGSEEVPEEGPVTEEPEAKTDSASEEAPEEVPAAEEDFPVEETAAILEAESETIGESADIPVEDTAVVTDAEPEAETVMLHTNRHCIVRVLSLLLDNAKKFTKEGDSAVLRIDSDNENIRFTVENSGISIPATEAEHIFEEFVQLDNYKEGTGIGLTVARSIAQRLGGDVTLDTTFTNGAKFIFTLPK